MKTTTASTLAIAALTGISSAQLQPGAGLPNCVLCITNMVSLHASLGCDQPDDISCLCSKPDFGFGIRDCAVQACENVQQAERVISEGKDICARAEPAASPAADSSTAAVASASGKTLEGVEVVYTTSGSVVLTTTAVIGTVTPTPSPASGSATGKVDVASSEQDATSSLASVSSSLESSASASASGFTSEEGKQQDPTSTITQVSGSPAATAPGSFTSATQSAAGAAITAGVELGLVGGLVGFFL
ncbi:hypothetical protein B0T21DRAFT_195369 [Apiosordaria backusii]|uniref:CFEM domain-containing protein n=1 Tax=Apiosordaria backusii TaxID=314023 RepID=A0AA40BDR6_9PEZI|nr:hypothetical protein B0T21DRAFT_195369 [Apiosordaria backusii]